MWDPFVDFKEETLPNGLTVCSSQWPDREWQYFGFIVHSGAKDDPIGQEGVAHFVEHLLVENCDYSQQEIDEIIKKAGGKNMFGMTSFHYSYYSFFLPKKLALIKKVLGIYSQMILYANITREIEAQRRVIREEFNKSYPSKYAYDLQYREFAKVYAGHWLERMPTILGSPATIEKIKKIDLQIYYDRHFTPKNITVVSLGGMSSKDVIKALKSSQFSEIKPGERNTLPLPEAQAIIPIENSYIVSESRLLSIKKIMRAVYYRSISNVPGTTKEEAVVIFCGMLSKVLFEEIRVKKQWSYDGISVCYYVFTQFYQILLRSGAINLAGQDMIQDVVNNAIESLRNNTKLMQQVKNEKIGSKKIIDLNGKEVFDSVMDDYMHYHKLYTLTQRIKGFKSVKISEINKIVDCLEPSKRRTQLNIP